jgi:DHA1 family multidrug resistance protein-like MFS transporter
VSELVQEPDFLQAKDGTQFLTLYHNFRITMQTWQRNLYTLWVAELVTVAGFTVVHPFLPYYVQELGVTELRQVEFWSGLVFASHGVVMAIFSPIWGSMADRYGRKLMVVRAMFGGAVVMGAMGFVQNVQQLVVLRALQGCLTGTTAAATTLVASSVPRQRAGQALGLLQMAVYSGASAGPLLGGLVADHFGYRAAFVVTGVLLFLAGITVAIFVHEEFEPPHREVGSQKGDFWLGVRVVFRSRELLGVLGIELMMRWATRIMVPVLPLFVQTLVPGEARVASLVGLITGLRAVTGAVGAVLLGRASDRWGYRTVLLICALGAVLVYMPQFFVTTPIQLLILQAAAGAAMGGGLAAIGALLANLSPKGRQGAVYGLDWSAVSAANGLGPMTGAVVAMGLGLRASFLFAAAVYGLAVLMVMGALIANRSRQRQRKLSP